ncbi:MAG: DNA polymerase/3'-5' exonuclease PolX [Halofilum sp. (in: g-proteobacteria)]
MSKRLRNKDIADHCERLANLLEIEGANPFRVRAWRNAAATIAGLSHSVADLVEADTDLTEYPHIGHDIAEGVRSLVTTGHLPPLDEIAARVPPELADLTQVQGLGPKGVKALYDHFRLRTLDDLERVLREGRVRELSGFGAKKEAALLDGIQRLRTAGEQRTRLADAETVAAPLRDRLAATAGVTDAVIAGSWRRRRETVGDIDLLVATDDGDAVMERLVADEDVEHVVSHGSTRSTVILQGGLQVDMRAIPPGSFGAALLYFTGSKQHNVALRQRAVDHGWKLNEYGLYDGETLLERASEADIYRRLGLDWIPPELREDHGEIEAAASGSLPDLVTVDAIRGNLHGHTDWSDGKDTLAAMIDAARERGHDYIAITDHGPRVRIANGLSPERLAEQADAIDALAAEYDDITILKGCEVDILGDGSLDLPDEVLARLDIVVCSIHYELRRSRAEQTEWVLRAMENPHFMIWGHPTAREINRREPIDIDLGRCLEAAAGHGIAVEINAQPKRLDLSDTNARLALEKGCRLTVNTDAHATHHLDLLRHGIDQARRAGATAGDIINTRDATDLQDLLRSR